MEKSFGLLFHLKKNAKLDERKLTVYMRITVDGYYCEISTKRKCEPGNGMSIRDAMEMFYEI